MSDPCGQLEMEREDEEMANGTTPGLSPAEQVDARKAALAAAVGFNDTDPTPTERVGRVITIAERFEQWILTGVDGGRP